jgi:hypothetical protein
VADDDRGKGKTVLLLSERTHQQLRDKLYAWGLHKQEVEKIIALMIEERVSERRTFCHGLCRWQVQINHWANRN